MKAIPSRKTLRWFHFIAGLTFIGYVYMPPQNVLPYAAWFKYLYFPVLFITGIAMWMLPRFRR